MRFLVLDVSSLAGPERMVLADDVRSIITDEQRTQEDAERVLRSRIGGQEALGRYVACLMANPAAKAARRRAEGRS